MASRAKSRIASSFTAATLGVIEMIFFGRSETCFQTRPNGPRQRAQMRSISPSPRRSGESS